SDDKTLKVWDISEGMDNLEVTEPPAQVNAVAIIPDGSRAISATGSPYRPFSGSALKIWSMESGRELYALTRHAYEIKTLSITPNGRRAISVSADSIIRVWDIESATELLAIHGHSNPVAITPNGCCVVSALNLTPISDNYEPQLCVWDIENGM